MQTLPTQLDPTGCRVSEKYDGIQGRWDGRQLTTRTGERINAPDWWTSRLPNRPQTGELWIGRGTFERLQSIVCRDTPDDRWADVQFMVFDEIEQTEIKSPEHLNQIYSEITTQGGEGVVVTDKYGDQYKKKPSQDAEGVLIGFVPGAGRNQGMIGALIVRNRSAQTVKLNIGNNKRLRKSPPTIGAIIRYRYSGLTSTGLPRFARFDGIRAEKTLEF